MKTPANGFQSSLNTKITDFLELKRALGRRYETEEAALKLLDRFLCENDITSIDEVDSALLDQFLSSRPRTTARSFNHLLGVMRRLFYWLLLHGHLTQSPSFARPRKETAQRIPFIFAADEIRQLIDAAGNCGDTPYATMRSISYQTIFTLLATLGLRVGEVARLQWQDVRFDQRILIIRKTKFLKNRLIPFGTRIDRCLYDYYQKRDAVVGPLTPETPLFSFTSGQTINPKTISQTFRHLLPRLCLKARPGVASPTVHSLRHTFAVRTLLCWYQAGIEPTNCLIHLSTFLGHVNISSTAVYLTITSELLQEANQRFEQFAKPLIMDATSL